MHIRRLAPVVALSALVLACSDGTGPRGAVPGGATALSGTNQTGVPGTVLADSLVVSVTDTDGNPLRGAQVTWSTAASDGSLSPSQSVTDASGRASAAWRLADAVGPQTAVAQVGSGVRAEFNAEAAEPPRAEVVQLEIGTVIGEERFPIGNSQQGGQGQTVSGIPCKIETIAYHAHPHLSLFYQGTRIAIPAGIGMMNPVMEDGLAAGSCYYWIHTHDATGIIHVEPPEASMVLTLGQLFDIWGQPLSSENVAGFRGSVIVYVDGERFRGDLRTIEFVAHRHIAIYVGTPLPPIPSYRFPRGY